MRGEPQKALLLIRWTGDGSSLMQGLYSYSSSSMTCHWILAIGCIEDNNVCIVFHSITLWLFLIFNPSSLSHEGGSSLELGTLHLSGHCILSSLWSILNLCINLHSPPSEASLMKAASFTNLWEWRWILRKLFVSFGRTAAVTLPWGFWPPVTGF